MTKKTLTVLAVLIIVWMAAVLLIRMSLSRRGGPALELVSWNLVWDERSQLVANYVLAGSQRTVEGVTLTGRLWPPMDDCRADVRGFFVNAPRLRPAAVLDSLYDPGPGFGLPCDSVRIISGEIHVGETTPIRLNIEEASWDRDRGRNFFELRINTIDSQPTSLIVRSSPSADSAGQIQSTGEWNLSGLDVTELLKRMGLRWSSRTDIGLLEFESRGAPGREHGTFDISSWVLMGKNRPRPFRVSVPSVSGRFDVSDTELLLDEVVVSQPVYDLVGAPPELIRDMMTMTPGRRMSAQSIRQSAISMSALAEPGAAESADTIAIRIMSLRLDTGAALMIDRPDHTSFAMKVTNLQVSIDGPARLLGPRSNTLIRFTANDRRPVEWKAITDFSVWPPQFRLTDVR